MKNNEIKITLPKLGESILSATVVQWFKKEGDHVTRDEPLLEVSTDKVNSEIPSPVSGILQEILAKNDQELQVGEPLAIILEMATLAGRKMQDFDSESLTTGDDHSQNTFLSPAVLRLLQEKKIPLSDIAKIPHTGQNCRLTKTDVEGYCPRKGAVFSSSERIKMTGMRKAIAENMVKSFYEAPHASLITEVDVTTLVKKIGAKKQSFLQEHGVKLTITAFVARAIARSLERYPLINSSLEGDTIVVKRFVNLGIAVSVDQGVMVPVLHNAQAMSLIQISKEIASLAEKARSHRLLPTDVQEGSITMTNFGMTGALIGIPIIRHPEVAIVGLGAIVKKVVVRSDDSIAIASMMMVSLTFDHRVLDGIYGCNFLNELKSDLQSEIE